MTLHSRSSHVPENERVFEFLAGLNKELDDVRWRILGRDMLPSSREVFAEVRREESRQSAMLGGSSAPKDPTSSDSSALFTSKSEPSRQPRRNDCPIYDHYNRPGHVKGKCRKLYGKPTDYSFTTRQLRENKGYQAAIEETPSTTAPPAFTKEKLAQLF